MYFESLSASNARLALRFYFLVVFFIIQIIATSFLRTVAKTVIVRRNSVPVTRAIGSLSGLSLVFSWVQLRRPPGGAVGFVLLLFIWGISQAADLMTAKLVNDEPIQSRCDFGQGLVFNDSNAFEHSDWNALPVTVLQNAQNYAVSNNCSYGIYKKVNFDPNFCPDENDILGSWTCHYVATNILFSQKADNSYTGIPNELYQRGLLYEYWHSDYNIRNLSDPTSPSSQLTAWSTSATQDPARAPWSVRATIQTNAGYDDAVYMDALQCDMTASGAYKTFVGMASQLDIDNWVLVMQGLMYSGFLTPAVSNIHDRMAMLLNTMVMVAGGGNSVLSLPPGNDTTQGCKKPVAYVPPAMEVAVLFAAGVLVVVAAAWVWAVLRLWHFKSHVSPELASEADTMPQTVEEWAVQAARAGQSTPFLTQEGHIEPSQLRQYDVGFFGEGQATMAVFKRKHG